MTFQLFQPSEMSFVELFGFFMRYNIFFAAQSLSKREIIDGSALGSLVRQRTK